MIAEYAAYATVPLTIVAVLITVILRYRGEI